MSRPGVESRVLDAVGRAMGRFAMLRPGDRVAVGVSGGKDSLCLLHALVAYRARAPFSYEVVAVTVQQGKFTAPIAALAPQIRALGVPWVLSDEPRTLDLLQRGVVHGCDVCSRHRRRALYRLADAQGCSVLALGHTADDAAEALLRNVLFNGRIASLPPVARSRKGGLRLIRPLVFVHEALTAAYAEDRGLAVVGCVCGDKESVRREIRAFLSGLEARHPGVRESISAALGDVNPYTLLDLTLRSEGAAVVRTVQVPGARFAGAVPRPSEGGNHMMEDRKPETPEEHPAFGTDLPVDDTDVGPEDIENPGGEQEIEKKTDWEEDHA